MIRHILLVIFIISASYANSCLKCHKGIEDIREPHTKMAKAIAKKAKEAGAEGNSCIVCHGGNPEAVTKLQAHSGTIAYFKTHSGPKEFYPDPGSPWINKNSCGMCHKEQVMAQMNSLMMTEQGKIQGTLWGFGGINGYKHDIGNYFTKNPDDPHKRLGTIAYKKYMQKLHNLNPQVYPEKMKELPKAPTAEEVEKNPQLAVFTYLRQECLRCHTGSKGRQKRGDFRGIGCSSCHIPYSNNGYYEGNDPTIRKDEPGHMLVHQIQSSRNAKVTVHNLSYTGVPVETCTTCHNRGKRIGVSYQGIMETAYTPTYDKEGNNQPKLHTKHYLHLKEDVHYKKGMLCQDCHTSNDLHGDGFLAGSTLAPVEIECQDCHGTTRRYPWELPLGYSDEFDTKPASGKPRGVTKTLADYLKKGTTYNPKDGYLITARGNPYQNVVKDGNEIIVHLASGKDIRLKPLKLLKSEGKISKEGLVAMDEIKKHNDRLECYTCHDTWAPQCYGCHIKIDYSKGEKHTDWLAAAHDHDIHGVTATMRGTLKEHLIEGKVSETRSFLRWENPPLSQNGEGRISPTIPGCQTTVTVIGKDGKALLQNHIFKIPNVEGAGKSGQLGIDMSPVHSHTVQKEARSCESCHANPAALGYGIGGGKYMSDLDEDLIVDLMTADGKVIPKKFTIQKPKIDNLTIDWSRFVDENGTQLQSVGTHFKLSGPLDNETRAKLDRRGVCMSCHKTIPNDDLAVSLMHHVAETAGVDIDNKMHKDILNKTMRIGAWVQVLGAIAAGLALLWLMWRITRRRKRF
ncbi:multiheme c-type cytochrome [Hydrogenimonas thermophila]|uniref:Cytochrome c554 and c-prime n=1 Tax=Hydrogenimonas thermophila TaxID=223786 RepID=A0A1I5SQH9_9BACT|nr:multiheme c-type cytochrome [Hydrogenimonas thermophila]SFP73052.1 Cytochrome c554 and c-prime [Hydrogenimonas thermophila]